MSRQSLEERINRDVCEFMQSLCKIAAAAPGVTQAMVPFTVDINNPQKSGLPPGLCKQITELFDGLGNPMHPCIQAMISPKGLWPTGFDTHEDQFPPVFVHDQMEDSWKLYVMFSCVPGPYRRTWTVYGHRNPYIQLGSTKPFIHFEF